METSYSAGDSAITDLNGTLENAKLMLGPCLHSGCLSSALAAYADQDKKYKKTAY